MAVEDFLRTYQNSMLNKKTINPLTVGNQSSPVAKTRLGVNNQPVNINSTPSYGSAIPSWLDARKTGALNSYMARKSERTSEIAKDYADNAAGQIPVDKFGIVQDKLTDFSNYFNQNLKTTTDIGKAALGGVEAQARHQRMQELQELNTGYQINWTPGASSNNKGAQAVKMAMDAYNRGTPYVWGGNSLTQGVDCSGLVQQIYSRLGVSLPRSTYEQAKSGRKVSLDSLLPGDLIFYNTGSQDPNGIGKLSHVAIYAGNGKIVDARNSRADMQVGSINIMGGPVMAVRPW